VKRTAHLTTSTVPPWPEPAKLPYDMLLSIFQYATYPLIDENLKASTGISWLVKVALLRRDFAEPALAALYYNPPLESPERVHNLLAALYAQNEGSTIDYRRKIRYLDIDALSVLCFKFAGQDPPLLAHFLAVTPMLRGLRINWPNDNPAVPSWQSNVPRGKVDSWYGESIYDLLEEDKIALEEWKWNLLFGPQLEYPWLQLTQIHQRPAFRRIKTLELCRLSSRLKEPIGVELSAALGELPELENLTVSSPKALDPSRTLLLLRHVRPLKSLTFSYCGDGLDAETISRVLATQGSQLRHLALHHNPRLDLAFLQSLRAQCPQLESLDMDLTFFSQLTVVRGITPMYETLLPAECTPSWPRTLRRLSLLHLRKWDTSAATRFFESLLNAAAELSNLRELEIRMSVDADWKDRISFRDKWEALILRVFRRPWIEPIRWSDSAKRSQRLKAIETPGDSSYAGAVQGRCEHVDVRVENLRPMERQLDESNFLDDERSGDEDYQD
jgi:hypothetical protein